MEREYTLMMDNLMDNIIILSPIYSHDGQISNFRFEYMNKAASRYYRIPKKQAIGRLLLEVLPYYKNNGMFDIFRNTFLEKTVEYLEKYPFQKKHITKFLQIRVWRNSDVLIGTWRDITRTVRLEKDLQRSKQCFGAEIARLERLNNIAQIAAGIGHEVRNPLTTVKGFLQMFLYNPDFSEYADVCDMMISELDRANQIISEFLSLSKTTSASRLNHNINELIDEIYPLIKSQAILQDKKILLKLDNVDTCLIDSKEFRQILLNLVSNGLDATSEGTSVTISTYNQDEDVVLVVQDQGPGIDAQVLNHLGEPFVTTKEKGTGLGLATCFSIVKRYNGRIEVDSTGTGTCFRIYFPTLKQGPSIQEENKQISVIRDI